MNEVEKSPAWPLGAMLLGVDGKEFGHVDIRPGLTILVGPNGSGKTRALRAIKTALEGTNRIEMYDRKVRFLSAGRSSPFEVYRSNAAGPDHIMNSDAAVGHSSHRNAWWKIESLTGDLLALDARADLKLKVEARLQQLFDRSIDLTWSQDGLSPRITSTRGAGSYPANSEASGILQLVALLAAIHNDEIGALIIDEPEISLHPQHQAFLLQEMERVAGDPADRRKKLVIFATHAPAMLALRSEQQLPNYAFFNDVSTPPAQVAADEPMLRRAKLKALLGRLGATHRMAVFAERILLVEGPSDETIVTQFAHRLDWPLLARNAQVLPVTGKGEFPEVAKLFRLMGKQVAVLADLDALADDNGLVNHFSGLAGANDVASKRGARSIAELDGDLRNDLSAFITKFRTAISNHIMEYPDWSGEVTADVREKRLALALILVAPTSLCEPARVEAKMLSSRYEV